jgi:hypothetical protein
MPRLFPAADGCREIVGRKRLTRDRPQIPPIRTENNPAQPVLAYFAACWGLCPRTPGVYRFPGTGGEERPARRRRPGQRAPPAAVIGSLPTIALCLRSAACGRNPKWAHPDLAYWHDPGTPPSGRTRQRGAAPTAVVWPRKTRTRQRVPHHPQNSKRRFRARDAGTFPSLRLFAYNRAAASTVPRRRFMGRTLLQTAHRRMVREL